MNNQTVLELNNRTLDNCLFSLIIIPTKIYYKEGENLVKTLSSIVCKFF